MMFEWDGTDVTEIIKNAIIQEATYKKTIYWRVKWRDKVEVCIVRNINSGLLPCLIDEIKPIFSLKKIGTHWMKFDNKKFLLLRVERDEKGSIIYDLHLDDFKYHNSLKIEVQKIFVFRELLGMSKSYESSIILRISNRLVIPISFYDPNMEPSNCKNVIPNTVLDKWFKNTSIDEVLKKMLGIEKLDDIGVLLYNLRIELEKIVKRCNPESVIYIDEILTRIGARLQHIL